MFRTLIVWFKACIGNLYIGGLNVQGCLYTFLNFHLRTLLIFTPIPLVPKKCGLWINYMCMFKRELESVQHSHTNHFILLQNSICFSPCNWLSNRTRLLSHSNWGLVCGLKWDQKGTNKTLAPMGPGLFCQLLTSSKLPLIIFNTTI